MAIERKFVAQNLKEVAIKEFVMSQLSRVGLSSIKLQRTPLGDKILIRASRPGLVVGRAGSNIQRLTEALKEEFKLDNPQVEIEEVTTIGLDANIIAEMIVNSLERFGTNRFKGVGHRALQDVMSAGALGVEILISGKIPGQRARTWRFYQGHLKKCGDVAMSGVDVAYKTAVTKKGAVGVKVSIMPPTTKLPDEIIVQEPAPPTMEEVTSGAAKEEMEAALETAPAAPAEEKEGLASEAGAGRVGVVAPAEEAEATATAAESGAAKKQAAKKVAKTTKKRSVKSAGKRSKSLKKSAKKVSAKKEKLAGPGADERGASGEESRAGGGDS